MDGAGGDFDEGVFEDEAQRTWHTGLSARAGKCCLCYPMKLWHFPGAHFPEALAGCMHHGLADGALFDHRASALAGASAARSCALRLDDQHEQGHQVARFRSNSCEETWLPLALRSPAA